MNHDTEQVQPSLITCKAAASALYDFLDGRLENATSSAVTRHIETCKECAGHFAFARRVLALIPSSMPLATDTDALRSRIVGVLANEGFSAPE
jgi:anti-sigma factor RsiW